MLGVDACSAAESSRLEDAIESIHAGRRGVGDERMRFGANECLERLPGGKICRNLNLIRMTDLAVKSKP